MCRFIDSLARYMLVERTQIIVKTCLLLSKMHQYFSLLTKQRITIQDVLKK
jgi:hypothetical protein